MPGQRSGPVLFKSLFYNNVGGMVRNGMKGFRNEPEGCRLAFMSRKSEHRREQMIRRACELAKGGQSDADTSNSTRHRRGRGRELLSLPVARAVKRAFAATAACLPKTIISLNPHAHR